MTYHRPFILLVLAMSFSSESKTPSQTAVKSPIETIIVTATKRKTNLVDTPIAVTAISGEQLQNAGIKDVRDISNVATSFYGGSSNHETGATTFRIRGIGTAGENVGLESSVGVFLDGVYLSRPGMTLADLADIERVEVLHGPQGTLFGRNTSAGALSIISKKPSLDESEYWANITFGDHNNQVIQLGSSFSLIEQQLGARLSVAKRTSDGITTSVSSLQDSGTKDRYTFRGQLLWQPYDDMQFRLIADVADADENCCDAVILNDSPLALSGVYQFAGLPVDAGVQTLGFDALEARQTNASGNTNRGKQWGLSAHMDWQLDWADFSAVLSKQDYNSFAHLDLDYVGIDVAHTYHPDNYTDINTWSLEMRLQGNKGNLDWLVGAYYGRENIDAAVTMGFGEDYGAYVSGGLWMPLIIPELTANYTTEQLAQMPVDTDGTSLLDVVSSTNPAQTFAGTTFEGTFAVNQYRQNAQNVALFTHNTYALTNQLDVVLGLRLTKDSKDLVYSQGDYHSDACLQTLGKVGAGALPSAYTGYVVGFSCIAYTVPVDVLGSFFPSSYDEAFKDEQVTYSLKSVYSLTTDVNVYAGFTRGYKSGGINFDPTAAIDGASPKFDSEITDAWEFGIKGFAFDRRLRTSLVAFHQQIDGFQVLEFTGIQVKTFNVAKILSSGFEGQWQYSASQQLTLNMALTYLDARYPNDCDGNNDTNEPVSRLCGNDLHNAPRWVSLLGFDYQNQFENSDWYYYAHGALRFEDKRRTSIQAFDANGVAVSHDWQGASSKAQLRLGIGSLDNNWQAELWGNNLFDKRTRNFTFDVPLRSGATGTFIEAPRRYGITLRTQF